MKGAVAAFTVAAHRYAVENGKILPEMYMWPVLCMKNALKVLLREK